MLTISMHHGIDTPPRTSRVQLSPGTRGCRGGGDSDGDNNGGGDSDDDNGGGDGDSR